MTFKNPLTIQVESFLGGFIVLSTAIFFGALIYKSAQDFDSESMTIELHRVSIKTITPQERALMDEWIKQNHINIPSGKGYRYVKIKYPDRPWI